jgi:hypothetical protein
MMATSTVKRPPNCCHGLPSWLSIGSCDSGGHASSYLPLHPFIEQSRLFRLNEQVKMIRHQTPGKDLDTISLPRLQQHLYEGMVVPVLVKDLLSAVSAIDQVIEAIVG